MSGSIGRRASLRGGMVAAVVAASMFAAVSTASAYDWNVSMDAAQQCASGLPCDSGASGSAHIWTNVGAQPQYSLCGQFWWSNVHGAVAFGHIHQAERGKPENVAFTINLFGPPQNTYDLVNGERSTVVGCTAVPMQVQALMAKYPQEFMVTIHSSAFPGGNIRGQLGSGTLVCQVSPALCPGALTGNY